MSVQEGVKIRYLEAPVGIIGDENGHVSAMKVIKMALGEPDFSSGRRRPGAHGRVGVCAGGGQRCWPSATGQTR